MTPARGGLKGLYRQRKKKGGIAQRIQEQTAAVLCTQDGGLGEGKDEEELGRFDMDMTYGPCVGVTRLRRWDLGVRPPPHLRDLLLLRAPAHSSSSTSPPPKNSTTTDHSSSASLQRECLWADKV